MAPLTVFCSKWGGGGVPCWVYLEQVCVGVFLRRLRAFRRLPGDAADLVGLVTGFVFEAALVTPLSFAADAALIGGSR